MGTKVPVNERSRERKFPGTFVPRERKFPGTKGPRNESSRNFRSLGTKVLHRDFSFLGTKGLGYEKSVIHNVALARQDMLLGACCVNFRIAFCIRKAQGSRAVLNYKSLEYKLQAIVNCEVLRIVGTK